MPLDARGTFVLSVVNGSPPTKLSARQQEFVAEYVIGELAQFPSNVSRHITDTTKCFMRCGQPENLALVNAYLLAVIQTEMIQ